MQRLTFTLPGSPGLMAGLGFGDPARSPELLFLHANGFTAGTYRAMLAPLGERRRVLAVDQRGHGRSTLPAEPLGRPDWLDLRDDLVALLDALGPGPLVLSGHSMGATVSILAAAARPERVKGLVLLDPVLLPPELVRELQGTRREPGAPWPDFPLVQGALRRKAAFESREAAVNALLGRGAFRTWPDASVADYAEDGLLEAPEGGVRLACAPLWEASNYCAQGHDGWAALGTLRCPVRVLTAERGSTCDPEGAAAAAAGNPAVRVETVPGTTHFLPQEQPALARAALERALG